MKKEVVAKIFYYSGISWVLFFISRWIYGRHIRVINYHGTPKLQEEKLKRQVDWFSKWYINTSLDDLRIFFDGKADKKKRPGIIISFDDGKRNNYDVALPVLEKSGFTGWFFIPVGWATGSIDEQRSWQQGDTLLLDEYPNERVIISEQEICDLMRSHVVGCHTFSHHRMNVSDGINKLKFEIQYAQEQLEKLTDIKYRIFCWVGGESIHYTRKASEIIAESGYEFSFTTNSYPILRNANKLKLERTNIECHYSRELVLFQICGVMDILYYLKRRRLKSVFKNLSLID